MTQEALKLALDALENHTAIKHPQQIHYRDKAITAIKEALAQPEQEPVAWMYSDDHERMLKTEAFCTVYSVKVGSPDKGVTDVPLYTTPPQRTWVDLTRTQMQDVYFAVLEEHRGGHQMQGQLAFAEALQAKLKEKNT